MQITRANQTKKHEQFIQLSQEQLEELIQSKVLLAIEPFEEKVVSLKNEIKQLRESVTLISGKHDDHVKEYNEALRKNNQDKKDIKQFAKLTEELQKRMC